MIVGLGNPGREYDGTRHNAGFAVLDRLAARHAAGERARSKFHAAIVEAPLPSAKCLLVKPTTFMNRSGLTVGEAVRFYKLDAASDVLVITDDIALPVGTIRLRPSGGHGGHNGLRDIERALGHQEYARLRVGVGAPGSGAEQVGHVLGKFHPDEKADYETSVDRAADATERFVAEGIDAAMNAFNVKSGGGGFKKPSLPPASAPPSSLSQNDTSPSAGDTDPGWLGQ
ncbi:MAG: aminoacyl-tRNA hydrolase [Planctomycetota bacterium]